MSIINQMLQDLEQRNADGVATGGMARQVRAVPHVRKVHAAWFVAAVLAVLLGSLLVWLWLRPVPLAKASPIVAATPAHLALKIASDLDELHKPAVTQAAVVDLPKASPVVDVPPVVVAREVVVDKNVINDPIEKNESSKTKVAKSVSVPVVVSKPARVKTQATEDSQTTASGSNNARVSGSDKSGLPDAPVMLNKQVQELTPQQRAENDYRKATGLAQQGHIPEAISLLEQVLQTDAQNTGARQTLIALLLNSKRQDDAARRAQEGLALDPKQAGFAMILARLQLEKGAQQLAITTLQKTLPYAQDRPEYMAFLAALLQREGRHKEAVEQYLSALRKTPQNGVWWMGMGISLQADNRTAEAREAFTRARETNSLSPELQAFVEQKLKQLPH